MKTWVVFAPVFMRAVFAESPAQLPVVLILWMTRESGQVTMFRDLDMNFFKHACMMIFFRVAGIHKQCGDGLAIIEAVLDRDSLEDTYPPKAPVHGAATHGAFAKLIPLILPITFGFGLVACLTAHQHK